jgi:hypothetical protein
MTEATDHPYYKAFKGELFGILKWEQLDDLWEAIRSNEPADWYIYAVGEEPPTQAVTVDELHAFITEIDKLLRTEHEEKYCGIVYADNRQQPTFVKIYDPNNLGVSCGYSDNPPLPGWVLSHMQPIDLPAAMPQTGSRKRWWNRLFGN